MLGVNANLITACGFGRIECVIRIFNQAAAAVAGPGNAAGDATADGDPFGGIRIIVAQLDGLAALGRTEQISDRASDELIAAVRGFILQGPGAD